MKCLTELDDLAKEQLLEAVLGQDKKDSENLPKGEVHVELKHIGTVEYTFPNAPTETMPLCLVEHNDKIGTTTGTLVHMGNKGFHSVVVTSEYYSGMNLTEVSVAMNVCKIQDFMSNKTNVMSLYSEEIAKAYEQDDLEAIDYWHIRSYVEGGWSDLALKVSTDACKFVGVSEVIKYHAVHGVNSPTVLKSLFHMNMVRRLTELASTVNLNKQPGYDLKITYQTGSIKTPTHFGNQTLH